MVEIGTDATRREAELAQAALAGAGVPSRLVAHDDGGTYPCDLVAGARLLVDEADVELASEILGRTERTRKRSPHDTIYALGGHRRYQLAGMLALRASRLERSRNG